jgi:DNA mismatch endonuclease (patch repair protein)
MTSRIRGKNTSIEIRLRKALWAKVLRYRTNLSSAFGRPDLAIKKYKIAIFYDSEFWHGLHLEKMKMSNNPKKDFWISKVARNIERDRVVNATLKENGWLVVRF